MYNSIIHTIPFSNALFPPKIILTNCFITIITLIAIISYYLYFYYSKYYGPMDQNRFQKTHVNPRNNFVPNNVPNQL